MMILSLAFRNSYSGTRLFSGKKLLSSLLTSDLAVIKIHTPDQTRILKTFNSFTSNNFSAPQRQSSNPHSFQKMLMSSSGKEGEKPENESCDPSVKSTGGDLSMKEKLKFAVRDYGATVIVFHVGISLISLGIFYLAASSGLDVQGMVQSVGFDSPVTAATVGNAGTFVVAYAIHKVFAPVRITITLTAAPFIVRYLRGKGILKVKPKKPQ